MNTPLQKVMSNICQQLTEATRLKRQYGPEWEAKPTDELLQKIQTEARVNPRKYNGRK